MNDLQILKKLEEEIGIKLKKIDLDSINRGIKPGYATDGDNIIGLSLKKTPLVSFPLSLLELKHLISLSLRDNKLSNFPKQISGLKNLQNLYLSFNHLTQLPPEIGELKNLRTFNIRSNQLTQLPPEIGKLKNLQNWNLGSNQLTQLPPEIGKLENLQNLFLDENQLIKLPPEIKGLKNLQDLFLISNQLTQLPPEIGELENLQYIDMMFNHLEQLPPEIKGLKNLNYLDLTSNHLTQLPREIGELENLQTVILINNRLTYLPSNIAEWGMQIKWEYDYIEEKRNIFLEDNPLETPPVEIVKQGTEPVHSYFESLQATEETARLFEAKLLVFGREEAGKTSLINKLINHEYQVNPSEKSAGKADTHKWVISQTTEGQATYFCVNLREFLGHESVHAIHQPYLTTRSLYMLVWDARNEEDYIILDYWLNFIKIIGGNSPVILVMNKADKQARELNQESIRKKYPNVRHFYQVSTLTGKGIEELRRDITDQIVRLPHVRDELPKIWKDIREHLEELGENVISYKEFEEITGTYGLDRKKAGFLCDYFHELGIFLHFRDEEFLNDIVILKPEWGTSAVYKVLDNPRVRKSRGKFSQKDLGSVWSCYPSDFYPHLVQLMKKFELCFEIGQTLNYAVPELMALDAPRFEWDSENNLCIEYHYDFMPFGIIPRFIVRRHMDIFKEIYWKNGVLLEYDNTRIKIVANPVSRKINVSVQGSNMTDALAIVRSEFNYIHDTLNRPRVKEMIRCNCSECRNAEAPHFYEYKQLEKFKDKGKAVVSCHKSVEDILIDNLLMEVINPPGEWDVLIAFAWKDFSTVNEITDLLKRYGIRYWLEDEQIMPGDSIPQKIEQGVQNSRFFMPCFSRNQIKAGWVREEYGAVLDRMLRGNMKQSIIPLVLDDMDDTEIPHLLCDIRYEKYSDSRWHERLLRR
ncbi:MAG: TIR domain-containing protein [Desulfobacterales bacterium]|nr:TIR domain-containing protein [Desulfobacterales bacterium]